MNLFKNVFASLIVRYFFFSMIFILCQTSYCGVGLISFLKKTDRMVGSKLEVIVGPVILYYGFYHLWRAWQKTIHGTRLGQDTKKYFTLGIGEQETLNYIIPLIGIGLMPKIDIKHGLQLYSNLFDTTKKTINELNQKN